MWKCPRECHRVPAFRVTKILGVYRKEKFYYGSYDKDLEHADSIELLHEGDPDWDKFEICNLCGAVVKWVDNVTAPVRSHCEYAISWETQQGNIVTTNIVVMSHAGDVLVEHAAALDKLGMVNPLAKQAVRIVSISSNRYFDQEEEEE